MNVGLSAVTWQRLGTEFISKTFGKIDNFICKILVYVCKISKKFPISSSVSKALIELDFLFPILLHSTPSKVLFS